ncbi:MAG: NAD(P)H-binding protein [bacterium]|nr:NAD(P)H-binding protein [bacterium]
MLLITGATGQLGSTVLSQVLQRSEAKDVAVLVRDEAKASHLARAGVSVVIGDYDDPGALERAFVDVDRVLLIAGTEPGRRVEQHQNVIDAAKGAGVGLLGFTSRSLRSIGSSRNTLMADYFDTEERIRRGGVPHVIFRNGLYLDTVPIFVGGDGVRETGIALPAGSGKVAFALRRELGEAIANAMIDLPASDRTVVLSAPSAHGFGEIAAELSAIFGSAVGYLATSEEEYVAQAVDRGVPEQAARRALGFFADIRDNQLDETSVDFAALLGREPVHLGSGLRELFTV